MNKKSRVSKDKSTKSFKSHVKNSAKSNSSTASSHPWFLYLVYIVIVAVVSYNLVISINAQEAESEEEGGFMDSCCGDQGGCCGDDKAADENSDPEENTEETDQTPEAPYTPPTNCQQTAITASSSASENLFTYTFTGQICEDGVSITAYLEREAQYGGNEYFYQNYPVRKYQAVSGSGNRNSNFNFTKVCVTTSNGITQCG